MKQFDVYDVNLDPTVGAEIQKKRPCVIISPDALNKNLKTVIVAPLSHSDKGYPSRIQSSFNGEEGEIALDQIRAVDKTRLVKKLGVIDTSTSKAIRQVLQTMFS